MSPPSTSRHHSDWLSLVEVSGPFVSLPVLLRIFPQGLEPRDPAQAKALRAAYEEWQDHPTAPGKQRAWVHYVLTAVLGYPQGQIAEGQTLPPGLEANMPEMGETLRPDFALIGPAGSDTADQAQLLIASYPAEQSLDKPVIGKHWKATPATRIMELLHSAGVPLGLITNGEHWMLVYAPRGETTGYASWYGALWLDEHITLRAFHSLLGVRRFFGVAADNTLLALLKESAQDQQEVTDQLGYQVREAVEVLVQSFDALDRESNRSLLKGVPENTLYDAALTIMMRLVFLFSAEERGLLHLGKPLYDDNYAVSTLQGQLQEVADRYGEEVLERRYDAWSRLLATFRAVHGGVQHQDLLMQAYGGSLFHPDRYPFLEGRVSGSAWRNTTAAPLTVNNRVVLHLLNSLQRLRTKIGTGGAAETRRISFRALGVEQIGHVYEGLLDHTAVRASEPVLGIKGTRKKEPEIPLSRLESILAEGQEKLIEFLKDETGRSVSSLRRALDEGRLLEEHQLLIACGQEEKLLARLRPFTGLIRKDSFERPLVVLSGSVYVTAGNTRRSTGTHYTPPSLTVPIVQHTLEPMVYVGPAEGWPREQWKLKSPKTILDLKVCDMAMGSGAFLVQVCRYLSERLVEAWENEEKLHPGEVLITPDGKFSEGSPSERLLPADANERVAIARRVVADRCLYGVDINPMAVEMAKLSLWLITVDRHRPFTFLDHAFKCGDSLLGITSLQQLEKFSLQPGGGKQMAFSALNLWRHIEEAKKKREALEKMPSDTPDQIAAKAALYAEAEETVAKLNAAADVLVAVELKGLKVRAYEAEREASVDHMMTYWAKGISELANYAFKRLSERRCFHWALMFPEVVGENGFSAFVGNPPFLGGKKISSVLGESYERFLKLMAGGAKGAADLCCYFFRRGFFLLRPQGGLGLLATNSINEGDSREIGLGSLIDLGGIIYFATNSFRWPGQANVFASQIHVSKGATKIQRVIDAIPVETINSSLQPSSSLFPYRLKLSEIGYTQGPTLNGEGFIITEGERAVIVAEDSSNASVLFPYVNAKIFNSMPVIEASSWAINFGTRDIEEASEFHAPFSIVTKSVKPSRDLLTKQVHEECYWLYWDKREGFFESVNGKSRLLVCPITTKHLSFRFFPTHWVFSHALKLFDIQDFARFGVLQSTIHESWARQYSSRLKDDLRYSTSDAFDTFGWPAVVDNHLENLSEKYYLFRENLMKNRSEGLTAIYNRFHSLSDNGDDINEFRNLQMQLDLAVASAYDWQDLDLGHGFHETKQGNRFTISETARRTVLDRLLALNHQRHAEEVASGLHEKKKTKTYSSRGKRGHKKATIDPNIMPGLFD
jgi:hypothetical protein